jgi:hypothetical protein
MVFVMSIQKEKPSHDVVVINISSATNEPARYLYYYI